MKKSGDVRA